MDETRVTLADMDALLAFLPIFEDEEYEFVVDWTRWPVYSDDVKAFFRLAGMPPWSDRNYLGADASKKINDDAFIAAATLVDIQSMLTVIVRSERFGDGNWMHFLDNGRIVAILRRLKVLRGA